jgi:hypothetical protein
MKKKKTRASGGGKMRPSGFGSGGMNSDGPNYMNIGYDRPHTFGKSPDSLFSRMSQQQFPKDYFEDPNMLEEDEEETLEEFFARMIKMPLREEDKKDLIDEDDEEKLEKEVDEMISGGVPGPAVTIGLGPDAKKRKKDWRSKFDKFSRRMFGGGK